MIKWAQCYLDRWKNRQQTGLDWVLMPVVLVVGYSIFLLVWPIMLLVWLLTVMKRAPSQGVEQGFAWRLNEAGYRFYKCRDCGTDLVPGPEGCGSLNAVCPVCKVNHGCLPCFWDRP